jgi:WD40 repeat protein
MSHKLAIEKSPLQAYASALLFSPARSLIKCLFRHEEPEWITIKPPIRAEWSACLQTLEGHSSSVNSVAFSHNSTRLASASGDSTVRIWDASSGACLQTLKGHSSSVNSVAFSHNSTRLASASYDSTVRIWDASSGACLQTLMVGRVLRGISFDATGLHLHTELGVIAINAPLTLNTTPIAPKPQGPQYQGGGLSSDRAWITYDSKNVVWLPSEYRPSCSAVSANTVGIGVGSGKVWMCSFNLEMVKEPEISETGV